MIAYDLDYQTGEDSIEVTVEQVLRVQITAPERDAVITEETTVTAEVTSNAGVTSVDFFLDGLLQAEDLQPPYEWVLDPLLHSPGPHVIRVEAEGTAGGLASDEIIVLVEVP